MYGLNEAGFIWFGKKGMKGTTGGFGFSLFCIWELGKGKGVDGEM